MIIIARTVILGDEKVKDEDYFELLFAVRGYRKALSQCLNDIDKELKEFESST